MEPTPTPEPLSIEQAFAKKIDSYRTTFSDVEHITASFEKAMAAKTSLIAQETLLVSARTDASVLGVDIQTQPIPPWHANRDTVFAAAVFGSITTCSFASVLIAVLL